MTLPQSIKLAPGMRVDRYHVHRQLGEGSYGIVALAEEEPEGALRALKILKLWETPVQAHAEMTRRFRLEYETGLIDSPHIVQSRGFGVWNGNPYFVMDYYPKGNLQQQIQRGLPQPEAVQLAVEILYGLRVLHQNGKIHRDLKPENVLLDEGNRIRLTDFGIAGHLNAQLTKVGKAGKPDVILGSYAYMPPEQINPFTRRDTLLPTIDIFAFGVLCYELFAGRYPFGPWELEQDIGPYLERASQGQWDPIRHYCPGMDVRWVQIVERCLAPNYRDRYQEVAEILGDLGLLPDRSDGSRRQHLGRKLALCVMQGEENGKIYRPDHLIGALNRNFLRIGRLAPNSENDIAIREEWSAYISRMHATLEWNESPPAWRLRDGQWNSELREWRLSKNGVFVNGRFLDAATGWTLCENDIIAIGDTTLRAEIPV